MTHRNPDQARAALSRLLSGVGERPLLERFPVVVDGREVTARQVLELLGPFLTDARQERIRDVVAGRTYSVVPVVEGLVNVGNVSAVMRSAEAMGYQEINVVTTGEHRLKQSERTSQGAEKWLDVRQWQAPERCVRKLQDRGYTVVAMHLDEDAVPIRQVDFTQRTALVFGNEAEGVSQAMLQAVDQRCIVPLPGFTESFNVSVAAAIALYHAQQYRIEHVGSHADLSEQEKKALTADFYLRSVGKSAEQLLRRLLREQE